MPAASSLVIPLRLIRRSIYFSPWNVDNLKFHIIDSRNHTQQCIDERFFQVLGVVAANGIKIICQGGPGNDMSQIREGKTVTTSDFMSTFRDFFEPCPIDPCNSNRHHREIDMVDHGMGIT